MNIHPIFVHFPIGLLVVYALIELFESKRFRTSDVWLRVRAVLVIAGTLGAYFALSTGEMAEHIVEKERDVHALIETHSLFAGLSTAIFSLLAVTYLIQIAAGSLLRTKPLFTRPAVAQLGRLLQTIARIVQKPIVIRILALFGLVLITITGALGGAIAYSPDVDPFVHTIYSLFF